MLKTQRSSKEGEEGGDEHKCSQIFAKAFLLFTTACGARGSFWRAKGSTPSCAKVQLVLGASLLGACGASDKYCLNAASISILINYKMANVAKLHVNGLPRCSLTQGGLRG